MERILLVEPDYSNKYPPLGLMKLATYHKNRKDRVEFYKGKAPYTILNKIDRVYITTLFTFYYDITIETVKYYQDYIDNNNIFVGGIASTLLYDDFKNDTNLENIITGQLTCSSRIGYSDNINIDSLPLDYDILDDISYEYPSGDNFFIYTTRGCPRRCEFCAVSTLEPKFKETNHIISQITEIRDKFGDKRNVLIMDNNILFSSKLHETIDDLNAMGFQKNTPNYIYPNPIDILLKKIIRRKNNGNVTIKLEHVLYEFICNFKSKIKNFDTLSEYENIIKDMNISNVVDTVLKYRDNLFTIVEKYRYKKSLQRYVDFNQGADARLLTTAKMNILKNIPIKPFRLAYDNIEETESYFAAFEIAYDGGVRHFSNYILYNYDDKPEDLWTRLHNSIIMFEVKSDIQAFSFPMKYAPLKKSREYVGDYWNKKFLSAINVVINVTNGSVAKEKDFFYKAFGSNIAEYRKILTMPNEFIKHRFLFEENGLINQWETAYLSLTQEEKVILIEILSGERLAQDACHAVADILKYYRITKHMVLSQ
uniref:Radical SAM domain protein n=1 Tax=Geobacter sp. (strain M21) TaxID=443144 RepID=C6DYA9_GEOSM